MIDSSTRHNNISSTGSNIVHSPYSHYDASPSNPLSAIESFKKSALEELMSQHSFSHNLNSSYEQVKNPTFGYQVNPYNNSPVRAFERIHEQNNKYLNYL
jgi:hypothetical protein